MNQSFLEMLQKYGAGAVPTSNPFAQPQVSDLPMAPQSLQFSDLLGESDLSGYSQYFQQDPSKIAEALGLKGQQATQFSRFFMPFQQEKFMEAAEEIEAGRQKRLGMIGEQYAGQRVGAQQQLGQTMRQLAQRSAQSGFAGTGAMQTSLERLGAGARQTLQDILGRRESAMLGLDEQVGRQKAGLTGALQSYLQSIFGRAERLYGLDPTGGGSGLTAENVSSFTSVPTAYSGDVITVGTQLYEWDSDNNQYVLSVGGSDQNVSGTTTITGSTGAGSGGTFNTGDPYGTILPNIPPPSF